MEENNVNTINMNEDEMFEIIVPLDSEKENIIVFHNPSLTYRRRVK